MIYGDIDRILAKRREQAAILRARAEQFSKSGMGDTAREFRDEAKKVMKGDYDYIWR